MTDIFENMAQGIADLYNNPQPLAAVWIMEGVVTSNGKIRRVGPGELIEAKEGLIIDLNEKPTHEVLRCFGTLVNQFEFACRNLETEEIETIKYLPR
jgi:hypothetical protein